MIQNNAHLYFTSGMATSADVSDESTLGKHCTKVGITEEVLLSEFSKKKLRKPLTKGIVFELNAYRVKHSYSWNVFYEWLSAYSPKRLPSQAVVRASISRLQKRKAELSRNKKHDDIDKLFQQPFASETQLIGTSSSFSSTEESYEDLVAELSSTKEALDYEHKKTEELSSTLQSSRTHAHNISRKLKRRDEKIEQCRGEIGQLSYSYESVSKEVDKLQKQLQSCKLAEERNRVGRYRKGKQVETISEERTELQLQLSKMEDEFTTRVNSLESKLNTLTTALETAQVERDCLAEKVSEFESKTLITKVHNRKYLDSVRQCCMELLGFNVGVRQIEPVMRSVLHHIAEMEVEAIPKPSTITGMIGEMKGLTCQQLGEQLSTDSNLTLHSDGTTKFGHHYGSYQISTKDSAYSLGLGDMVTGTANQILTTLKQILADIELAAGEGVGDKIIANLKNTMSDRHIVQKNFNTLLEEYRSQVLPSVVSDWSNLSEESQAKLSTLNNFFCGMYLIVGMADVAASSLLEWEKSQGLFDLLS